MSSSDLIFRMRGFYSGDYFRPGEIAMSVNQSSFGEGVKDRRGVLGLTQDELARRVGCALITDRKSVV